MTDIQSQYSRQDAIRLSGSTSSQVSYFERLGFLNPQRIGQSKKPVVLYSASDIERLRSLHLASRWFKAEVVRAFAENEEPVRTLVTQFLAVASVRDRDTLGEADADDSNP